MCRVAPIKAAGKQKKKQKQINAINNEVNMTKYREDHSVLFNFSDICDREKVGVQRPSCNCRACLENDGQQVIA